MNNKKKYKILVFPCGSEIGLEIFRSLRYSNHIDLIGGSSTDDHGKYLFEKYIDNIPFIDSEEIIFRLRKIVVDYEIDAIYPTMDKVIWKLKKHENELGCKVISSPFVTTEVCLSKIKTYEFFRDKIATPGVYDSPEDVKRYPVFIKPDIGYGSHGTFVINNKKEFEDFISNNKKTDYVITEYLPGGEFTVDCFTDRNGSLRFVGPRKRIRVRDGISVNTVPEKDHADLFQLMAEKINKELKFRGAWFFQVKENIKGDLTLLEIAARLGGSSSLYRGKGINFALLSVFDAFGENVEIISNSYEIEIDRALDISYKLGLEYSTIFVDFDDCIMINGNLNSELIGFLYKAINAKKKIVLLTKHNGNILETLKGYRIASLFDLIITIPSEEKKSSYINDRDAIFIDDSFTERKNVAQQTGIPVFAPDMVECLK